MRDSSRSDVSVKAGGFNRRQFIASTAASAFVAGMGSSRAEEGGRKIKLGLIGCGGRGKWIADLFLAHGGYEIAAVADYFQDRADGAGEKFKVDAGRRYTGLSGYLKLLESDVEAVAIISPPFFHPEQAAAAVDSGRHVYLAKPVAVDVPGCLTIEANGKKATEKNLCFLVDFQTRVDPFFCEAISHVHDGDIGEIAFCESSYHCGRLGIQADPGTPEARLRNWVFDKALSGDIITEQNIHTLDVASWIMNQPPVLAFGTGGRKVRTDVGDCWDHFSLVIEYPNKVGVTFSSRQFNGYGTPEGIKNTAHGSKGVLQTQYGGTVIIRGEKTYRGGNTGQIYQEGAVRNIAAFHKNIMEKKFENSTVAPSVRSNLVTILGRTAAYTGDVVTWEQTLKSTERLDGKLKDLKA